MPPISTLAIRPDHQMTTALISRADAVETSYSLYPTHCRPL